MATYQDFSDQVTAINSFGNEVLNRFPTINTFIDGVNWVSDAQALIELLVQSRENLVAYRREEQEAIIKGQADRDRKSFFSRLVSPKEDEKLHCDHIKEVDLALVSIDKVISFTQDQIASVPTSKLMQTEMLRNLQTTRNKLSIELRSINDLIRQINVEARQRKASLTGVRSGLAGSIAKVERANITIQKEQKLNSYEIEKTDITSKLIELDKQIIWISHFFGDDPKEEMKVLRCSHCGRRVEAIGIPCEGCGAVLSEYL